MNADKSRVIITVSPVRVDGERRWHWTVRCSTPGGIKIAEDSRVSEGLAWTAAFMEAERILGLRDDRAPIARAPHNE